MSETPEQMQERLERAAQWRQDAARRIAIMAGATTWQDRALRLHAAGELSPGMLTALGLAPTPKP